MDPDPRIKEAFSKVKEDMLSIKLSLEELKKEILSSNNKNNALKNELYELKSILEEKKTNNNPFFLDSTGNKGVFRQTDNRQTTEVRQIFDTQPHLESIFISLTEKEFLLFLTLYQLEEEITAPLSYTQLANKLTISQSSVRDHIAELIRKQAPIQKMKINNKKVLLSVDKTFKSLNLMPRILDIRHFRDTQTTLTF